MQPRQHTLPTPYPVGPVHCYSFEVDGRLVLIDTGAPTEETKSYLQQLDLSRLRDVLITHCHIDHYGLAAWLEREYGCTVYLPYRDSLKIAAHDARLDGMAQVLEEVGFKRPFLEKFRTEMDSDSVFPDFPQQYRIAEQDLPADLGIEILACPGHSQSDLIYVGPDWAVTGDTMLREIFQSPLLDVDLLTGKRFRNYDAYCDTIVKLASLRDKKILPGHREYIVGVDYNIFYYAGKLLERTALARRFPLELPAPEVVDRLFDGKPMEPFLRYLKVSEVVFIRDFLADPHRLQQALEQTGLFAKLSDAFEQALN